MAIDGISFGIDTEKDVKQVKNVTDELKTFKKVLRSTIDNINAHEKALKKSISSKEQVKRHLNRYSHALRQIEEVMKKITVRTAQQYKRQEKGIKLTQKETQELKKLEKANESLNRVYDRLYVRQLRIATGSKAIGKNTRRQTKDLDDFTAASEKVNRSRERLNKQLERYNWLMNHARRSRDHEVYAKVSKEVATLEKQKRKLKNTSGLYKEDLERINDRIGRSAGRFNKLTKSVQETTKSTNFLNSAWGKFSIIMSGTAATIFVLQNVLRAIKALVRPSMELAEAYATMRGNLFLTEQSYQALEQSAKQAAETTIYSYQETSKALILLMKDGNTVAQAMEKLPKALALARHETINLEQAVKYLRGGYENFVEQATRLDEQLKTTSVDAFAQVWGELKKISTSLFNHEWLQAIIQQLANFLKYLRTEFKDNFISVWKIALSGLESIFIPWIALFDEIFERIDAKLRLSQRGWLDFGATGETNPETGLSRGIVKRFKIPKDASEEELSFWEQVNKKIETANEKLEKQIKLLEKRYKTGKYSPGKMPIEGTDQTSRGLYDKSLDLAAQRDIYKILGITTRKHGESYGMDFFKSKEIEDYLTKYERYLGKYKESIEIHKEFLKKQAELAPLMRALKKEWEDTGFIPDAFWANQREIIEHRASLKKFKSPAEREKYTRERLLDFDEKVVDTALKKLRETYKQIGYMTEEHYAFEIQKIELYYQKYKDRMSEEDMATVLRKKLKKARDEYESPTIDLQEKVFDELNYMSNAYYNRRKKDLKEEYDFHKQHSNDKLYLEKLYQSRLRQLEIKRLHTTNDVYQAISLASQEFWAQEKNMAEVTYESILGFMRSMRDAFTSTYKEVLSKLKDGGIHDYTEELDSAERLETSLSNQLNLWQDKLSFYSIANNLTGEYSIQLRNAQQQVSEISNRYKEQQEIVKELNKKAERSYRDLFDVIGDMWERLTNKMLDAFLNVIAEIAAKRTWNWLTDILGGGSGSGFIPDWVPIIGGLAKGGPAMKGHPYIIGEKGPELFVPKETGEVLSNRDTKSLIGAGIRPLADGTMPFTQLQMAHQTSGYNYITGKGFFNNAITDIIVDKVLYAIINESGGKDSSIGKKILNNWEGVKTNITKSSLWRKIKSIGKDLFTKGISGVLLEQMGFTGKWAAGGNLLGGVTGLFSRVPGMSILLGMVGGVAGDALGDYLNKRENELARDFLEGAYGYGTGRKAYSNIQRRIRESGYRRDSGNARGGYGHIRGREGGGYGFAKGGPIMAGQLAVVGEKGPELFVPHSSGEIISNNNVRHLAEGTTTLADQAGGMIATWKGHAQFKYFTEDIVNAIELFNIIDWSGATLTAEQMQQEIEAADTVMQDVMDFWDRAATYLDFGNIKQSDGQTMSERTFELMGLWDAMGRAMDRLLVPMNEFERQASDVQAKFAQWIPELIELGFSTEAIAEAERKRSEILNQIEQNRLDAINSVILSAKEMIAPLDEWEKSIVNVNSRFDDWIIQLRSLGATQRQLENIETMRISAVKAALDNLIEGLRDKFAPINDQISFRRWSARTGGNRAGYLRGQIQSTMGQGDLTYSDLSGLSDKIIEWYNQATQAAEGMKQAADVIANAIESIKYSGLNVAVPTVRAQAAGADYGLLRSRARSGNVEDIQKFANFASTYLTEAQGAYKSSSRYQDIYATVISDLESVGARFGSGGGIAANIESLENTFIDMQEWVIERMQEFADNEKVVENLGDQTALLEMLVAKDQEINVYVGEEQFDTRIERIAAAVTKRISQRNQTERD